MSITIDKKTHKKEIILKIFYLFLMILILLLMGFYNNSQYRQEVAPTKESTTSYKPQEELASSAQINSADITIIKGEGNEICSKKDN